MQHKVEHISFVILTINSLAVFAECELSTLCLELTIFLIVCGIITITAVAGLIVIGIKTSREARLRKNAARISRGKSVLLTDTDVYDEIEDKSLPKECQQQRKEVRPPQYEEVVLEDRVQKYDSYVHRRRGVKRVSKWWLERKSLRKTTLENHKSMADQNNYSNETAVPKKPRAQINSITYDDAESVQKLRMKNRRPKIQISVVKEKAPDIQREFKENLGEPTEYANTKIV